MPETFNVYCDESCHLENDRKEIMVLGAVWCPMESTRSIAVRIRELKINHGLSPYLEIKWVKVSPAKIDFYLDLLEFFFENENLHFRALIASGKSKLRHKHFGQNHDDWYYKMYFDMLKTILKPEARYRIYLDYKDTHGAAKVAKLHKVLSNNMLDFSRQIIEKVQLVRSHEVEVLQLADLMIGAISYVNRELNSSEAKLALVDYMRKLSGYSLTRSTLIREDKVNIFRWVPQEVGE